LSERKNSDIKKFQILLTRAIPKKSTCSLYTITSSCPKKNKILSLKFEITLVTSLANPQKPEFRLIHNHNHAKTNHNDKDLSHFFKTKL
jgi:hypothetical protein